MEDWMTIALESICFVPFAFCLMWWDGRTISWIQRRPWGTSFLFPFACIVRLMRGRLVIPLTPYPFLYALCPFFFLGTAVLMKGFLPFYPSDTIIHSDYGVLWVLLLSHGCTIFILLMRWASQSERGVMALPKVLQHALICFLIFFLLVMTVCFWTRSLGFSGVLRSQEALWGIGPLFPVACAFIVLILMRSSRAPFSLAYHDGYPSYAGALSFVTAVADYAHHTLFCSVFVLLFLGGWAPLWGSVKLIPPLWFLAKLVALLSAFSWGQAVTPRLRYDQMVRISVKWVLPAAWGLFFIYGLVRICLT